MKRVFISLIVIISLTFLYCETYVSGGTYSTSETWTVQNHPYIVQGDVTFTSGATLTIESGVSVKFVEDADLNILSSITAIGTLNNPILFYADDSELKWEGMHITSSISSELTYCDITDSDNGGLIISNSTNVDITYCKIHHNISEEGGGITIKEGSQYIDILSNEISYNSDCLGIGGRGLLCSNSCDININNNDIHDNVSSVYGGGIHLDTCNNCIVSNNHVMLNSASAGGGIYVDIGFDNLIESNNVYENIAEYSGGGIYLKTACDLINNNIYNNVAVSYGGGVYADNWGGEREFRNNVINNNTTYGRGGGILMYGNATIENCEVYSNTAGDAGGGIHCCIGDPIIHNCKIYDNTSYGEEYGGGGISIFHCHPTIVTSEISSNYANLGAGIFINDDTCLNGHIGRTIIDQCTISNNNAEYQCGGIYVYSVSFEEYSLIKCKNSIVYNNNASTTAGNEILIETYVGQIDESSITYCCIEPNGLYIDGNQNLVVSENNIFTDPLFFDAVNGDYHLSQSSRCIDNGDPDSDEDGEYWITDVDDQDPDCSRFDMGCYYYSHEGDMIVFTEGVHWISFPILAIDDTYIPDPLHNIPSIPPIDNQLYQDAYYLNNDGGLLQDNNGNPTILSFQLIEGNRDGTPMSIDPVFNNFAGHDEGFGNMLFRHEGYKIQVGDVVEPTVLTVGSSNDERLAANHTIAGTMDYGEYHWIGYWLPQPQNIIDAFGGNSSNPADNLWQYVEKVKAEDWYYDPCNSYRELGAAIPLSWTTAGKTMEYGKMYMVWFKDQSVSNFKWYTSPTVEEPIKKAESDNFVYTEKMDYEVIDVVDIPQNVTEIGVFEDETCVGAVVVQDSCAQILVYSDNANRNQTPFNFKVMTDNRGIEQPIDNYLVYDEHCGEFVNDLVVSGRQERSIIKFGDIGEPGNSNTPVIEKVHLYYNYPNPFNPETTISFSIPSDQKVQLTIYNLRGQKVRHLVNGDVTSGTHSVMWKGKDDNGKQVGSGLYFYKLKTGGKEISKKMLLLK